MTSALFLDVCDWWFACGCRSLWAGADAFCNVHAPAPPHCPICSHGPIGYTFAFLAVCLPQYLAAARVRRGPLVRTLVCLALFPVSFVVLGTLWGLADGYWR